MPTTITIGNVAYTIEKLDDGNIRVTHPGGQLHPMQGSDTDGVHLFEVHPTQTRQYTYWNEKLPEDQRTHSGPDTGGEIPWWSSKGWKKTRGE